MGFEIMADACKHDLKFSDEGRPKGMAERNRWDLGLI